jgi:hypothetical protein
MSGKDSRMAILAKKNRPPFGGRRVKETVRRVEWRSVAAFSDGDCQPGWPRFDAALSD